MTSSSPRWQIVTPRRVALRDVWPHEQRDFSRWVKDNVEFLNDHLGVTIDPETLSPEMRVGDFSADLVGTAVDDQNGEQVKVVIENQLERTDHDHLGKVVTYAAHHDARFAVWIAAEARPEHVKAVQWLNDHADMTVWLFVIEAVAVDDRHVAPLLRRIVGPSVLSRTARATAQVDSADAAKQMQFWSDVLDLASERFADRNLWQARQPRKGVHLDQTVPGCNGSTVWQFWVTTKGSRLNLRVYGDDDREVAHYFDALRADRAQIDAEFGDGLQWVDKDTMRANLLRWDNPYPGGYRDGPTEWSAAAPPLVDAMDRLVAATFDRLRVIPPYEPPPNAAEPPLSDSPAADDPSVTSG